MPSSDQLEIRNFFDKYVFGFMCADIERELNIARSGKPSGNFLCALGLMTYTEFMGGLLLGKLGSRNTGKLFNEFFDYMGPAYKEFNEKCDVYSVFRCGLAHEYFVKHKCAIFMLNISEPVEILGTSGNIGPSLYRPDAVLTPPVEAGIGKASNGRYYFIVEKYYQDFRKASENLAKELENHPGNIIYSLSDYWWLFQNGG
jgi:hypothetical protein